MSMFGNILSKLGIGKDRPIPPRPISARGDETLTPRAPVTPVAEPTAIDTTQTLAPIDVVAKLDAMARNAPESLHWQTSIVDLLNLLGHDSSFTARQELAAELNCPAEKMDDPAQMNDWLHKTVLQKLADNDGNMPPEMLH